MIDNQFVQKAEDGLEYINSNEEERMRAEFRERSEWKYNFDMESIMKYGKEQGRTEGRTKGIVEVNCLKLKTGKNNRPIFQ